MHVVVTYIVEGFTLAFTLQTGTQRTWLQYRRTSFQVGLPVTVVQTQLVVLADEVCAEIQMPGASVVRAKQGFISSNSLDCRLCREVWIAVPNERHSWERKISRDTCFVCSRIRMHGTRKPTTSQAKLSFFAYSNNVIIFIFIFIFFVIINTTILLSWHLRKCVCCLCKTTYLPLF